MTKNDLIHEVARKTECGLAMSGRVIEATLAEIGSLLSRGGTVSLTGFGSFSVSRRAQRIGRNPQTGQQIDIAATTVARFKPGKRLRDAVAGRHA